MDFDALKSAVRQGQRLVTAHGVIELDADGLDALEVWASLLDPMAEIIEDYPADPRGSRCLILSFVAAQPVHTVIAYPAKRHAPKQGLSALTMMITAYCPDRRPHEWSADYRKRQPRSID